MGPPHCLWPRQSPPRRPAHEPHCDTQGVRTLLRHGQSSIALGNIPGIACNKYARREHSLSQPLQCPKEPLQCPPLLIASIRHGKCTGVPRCANSLAAAKPSPLLAPVTMYVRPVRSLSRSPGVKFFAAARYPCLRRR